jgi:Glycine transporter
MPAPRSLPLSPDRLILGFDLAATFVFGLEWASVAVNADLDVFGVLVLGFVTAVGGGIIRDLLIGDVPPAVLRTSVYASAALFGTAVMIIGIRPRPAAGADDVHRRCRLPGVATGRRLAAPEPAARRLPVELVTRWAGLVAPGLRRATTRS